MRKFAASVLLAAMCTLAAAANIEIVVPFSAGGATDIVAREISQSLSVATVVVNKPGVDGVVAGEYFLSNQSNKIFMATTGSSLFAKINNQNLPYNPLVDFDVIGPIVTTATVVAVNSKSKYTNFDELIAQSKIKPVACGTSNSMAVYYANYLIKQQGINITVIPYKGTTPMLADLLGGHIDCAIDALPGFVGRDVRPLLMSAPDYTKNFNAPVLLDRRYRFENFFTVALGRTIPSGLRSQITNELIALTKNPEFIKSMAAKGYYVTRNFDLNYSAKLENDYRFLFDLQQTFK